MTALILLSDWQKSQIEFWRKIEGFPGYDVSSFGRIRSWRTVARLCGTLGGTVRTWRKSAKIMCQSDNGGYMQASIRNATEDKVYGKKTHRLVAQAFLPNPNNLPEVNHRTGVKGDNRTDNLEWVDHTGNMWHGWDAGLYKHKKYSDDLVLSIRAMFASGQRIKDIATLVGIDRRYVGELVNGKKRLRVA